MPQINGGPYGSSINSLSCSIVEKSCQHLSLQVQYQLLPSTVYFSFVYAKCTVQERQMLWADLMVGTPSDVPWFLTGDFNVIVNEGEKRGGLPFRLTEGEDFLQFMMEAGVSDAGFSGSNYTWCNNRQGRARVWKRLHRLLLNLEALRMGSDIRV